MTGLRMATLPLALSQGYSPAAVGVLLAPFALSQVFLALPAGLLIDHAGPVPASMTGYRMAFALMALLPLASCLLVRPTRELPPLQAKHASQRPETWDLLREPKFRRLMLAN